MKIPNSLNRNTFKYSNLSIRIKAYAHLYQFIDNRNVVDL
jgi:hypothetical protein